MKMNIAVLFGGESVEHEISIISAVQAMNEMDLERFNIIPVFIMKDRQWYTGNELLNIDQYKDIPSLLKKLTRVTFNVKGNEVYLEKYPQTTFSKYSERIDLAFPIVHGTNGEDGSLQGYFEMIGLPYVGCDVKAAAVGQDKVFMKQILSDAKLPITKYTWFFSHEYDLEPTTYLQKADEIGYPVVIKPASLGSSVGISIAKNKEELDASIKHAMMFDHKIIIEKAVDHLTEVNCSVLGDHQEAQCGILEQVGGSTEFLSYEDKYLSGGKGKSSGMASTKRQIPALISDKMADEIRDYAKQTFRVLNASGVSRIDFLINEQTSEVYVNEINTIPGSLAFYLWEPLGISFKDLTTRMIEIAIKRQRLNEKLSFSFDTNVLSQFNGTKGSKR